MYQSCFTAAFDSETVAFHPWLWQWSRHVSPLTVTVNPSCFISDFDSEPVVAMKPSCFTSDCDSEAVMFHLWLWQWTCHVSSLTVTMKQACLTSACENEPVISHHCDSEPLTSHSCDSEPVRSHRCLWQWSSHVSPFWQWSSHVLSLGRWTSMFYPWLLQWTYRVSPLNVYDSGPVMSYRWPWQWTSHVLPTTLTVNQSCLYRWLWQWTSSRKRLRRRPLPGNQSVYLPLGNCCSDPCRRFFPRCWTRGNSVLKWLKFCFLSGLHL